MSTSLYYRPVLDKKTDLPFELKKALSQKYWGHDGSLSGDWVTLNDSDISYLEGLRDAQVDGAQELIDAILKHDVLEIALIG